MRKKKLMTKAVAVLFAAMIMTTGCGKGDDSSSKVDVEQMSEDVDNLKSEVKDLQKTVEELQKAAETEATTTEEATTEEPTTEVKTEEPTTEAGKNDSKPAATTGGKWVDLDNMTFQVNGKTYKVGETTLQQMIDDKVPFEDISNAGNNIKANYESSSYKLSLGDYYTVQFSFMNNTSDNKKESECILSEVYLPVKSDVDQKILTFAFPLTMTEEELKANAGEPTKFSDYVSDDKKYVRNKYEYQRDSEKYYGSYGYSFEFVNGKLEYLYITFK